jgi:hypothetical protein
VDAIKWPGKIPFASERGHFPGCLAVEWTNTTEMNKWFEEHPGLLMVETLMNPATGHLVGIIAKQMTAEDLAEFEEFNRAWEGKRIERQQQKEAAEFARQEAEEKQKKEEQRLIALGKSCENNHGGLTKKAKK